LGDYDFRHVRPDLLYGYELLDLGGGQRAFTALPEKALLDLLYLRPGSDAPGFLQELRLQLLEHFDPQRLATLAKRSGSRKLERVVAMVVEMARHENADYQRL